MVAEEATAVFAGRLWRAGTGALNQVQEQKLGALGFDNLSMVSLDDLRQVPLSSPAKA